VTEGSWTVSPNEMIARRSVDQAVIPNRLVP
jgi:hypothetical protein